MATPISFLTHPDFADDRLTEVINVPPYTTGRPAQLGIFRDEPIRTTYVRLGIKGDELFVIPARERGGEVNVNIRPDQRSAVDFTIPHFPLLDKITPADIQNIVAWDSDYVFETVQSTYMTRMENLRGKHDLTHSYLDWGALNGIVVDVTGKQIANIYDEFDLSETVVEFDLETATTNIAELNRDVKARIRKELRGTAATGIRCLAGPEFFDRYVSHDFVNKQLAAYAGQTPNPGRDDVQDTFTFAGLTLERIDEDYQYRQEDGTIVTKRAIPDDEAIVLPLGTPFFKRYIAPPDTMSGANKRPSPTTKVFVSTKTLDHDKGVEVYTESNVLPICTRPQLMVRLKLPE
jgi:hypothetical protein